VASTKTNDPNDVGAVKIKEPESLKLHIGTFRKSRHSQHVMLQLFTTHCSYSHAPRRGMILNHNLEYTSDMWTVHTRMSTNGTLSRSRPHATEDDEIMVNGFLQPAITLSNSRQTYHKIINAGAIKIRHLVMLQFLLLPLISQLILF
jgi:hypothetical protein